MSRRCWRRRLMTLRPAAAACAARAATASRTPLRPLRSCRFRRPGRVLSWRPIPTRQLTRVECRVAHQTAPRPRPGATYLPRRRGSASRPRSTGRYGVCAGPRPRVGRRLRELSPRRHPRIRGRDRKPTTPRSRRLPGTGASPNPHIRRSRTRRCRIQHSRIRHRRIKGRQTRRRAGPCWFTASFPESGGLRLTPRSPDRFSAHRLRQYRLPLHRFRPRRRVCQRPQNRLLRHTTFRFRSAPRTVR